MPERTSAGGLIRAASELSRAVDPLLFSPPVTHVYNPLVYAWQAHCRYLAWASPAPVRTVFLGMNPGPWGMAQTGVPFGEIAAVRDFLRIDCRIRRPSDQNPQRPIQGFACPRSEVSGRRLWGLFADRFGTAERFFADHFVANYCPLVFMECSGRNRTPDKLTAAERNALQTPCDTHLCAVLSILKPTFAVAVGTFAERCLKRCLSSTVASPAGSAETVPSPQIVRILHPSPASPAANRDWAGTVTSQLRQAGVWP